MQITIKETTKSNIKFTISSNVSFANSIRRILLGEVPTVAIDVVEIRENRTVLADEMIAHRLGLVPIGYNGTLISKKDCDCDEFCSKCSIRFILCKSNDMDASSDASAISVTGHDLTVSVPGVHCHNSLIVKLAPGQRIDVTCIATLGTPQLHSKYCPVTSVRFDYDKNNRTRATKLWAEEDVKREWNQIDQSEEIDWTEVQEIEMDVEIVEGMGKPRDILLKAIKLFRDKMAGLLESID